MFIRVVFDLEYKIFKVYIAVLSINWGDKMHLSKISLIAHLKIDKASIKVPSKYTNIINIFLSKLAIEFLMYTKINNYTIKLINNWQLPYGLIYSLS